MCRYKECLPVRKILSNDVILKKGQPEICICNGFLFVWFVGKENLDLIL